MGRIFEPTPERKRVSNLLEMNYLKVHQVNDYYKRHKEGIAVNDGKIINKINDREVEK